MFMLRSTHARIVNRILDTAEHRIGARDERIAELEAKVAVRGKRGRFAKREAVPIDEDDGCPHGDPDCSSGNGDCHDACSTFAEREG